MPTEGSRLDEAVSKAWKRKRGVPAAYHDSSLAIAVTEARARRQKEVEVVENLMVAVNLFLLCKQK